jgi:hypothetical protein
VIDLDVSSGVAKVGVPEEVLDREDGDTVASKVRCNRATEGVRVSFDADPLADVVHDLLDRTEMERFTREVEEKRTVVVNVRAKELGSPFGKVSLDVRHDRGRQREDTALTLLRTSYENRSSTKIEVNDLHVPCFPTTKTETVEKLQARTVTKGDRLTK